MQLKDFENSSEARARRILGRALEGTPYWVNAHTRLEDVISPDEDDDREDIRFLRDAHFDLTIHKESHRKALWAFEFDGPTHQTAQQRRRDIRKNRICLSAGLPLLRIDDTHLNANEKQAILDWHVQRWLAYEKTMPGLLAERDREIAAMSDDEIRQAGMFLFGERPDLDVELVFELENPYEPTRQRAERLRRRFGMYVTHLQQGEPMAGVEYLIRFDWMGAIQDYKVQGFHSRWICPVRVDRFDGTLCDTRKEPETVFRGTGVWESRIAYPISNRPEPTGSRVEEFLAGGGWLEAGPPGGGAHEVGKVLAEYNALREVELWADRALRPRRAG
ncbi:DUF2726 domain-containing protein [Geodermatophilus sp. DSM 44513]|uniref:DUF2726 domain-containing protein n=1 Tax=Geodermatophilus sp. DSM 44513 TaxID=1528104 RepID=UPI0012779728|nr:DUF2726 domain-containing protein [Geodermatophilus sp. DSM 44513]WNV74450.1 DUF2726 domain-containing protein [Geodermatophilus sp. DSM 44513]